MKPTDRTPMATERQARRAGETHAADAGERVGEEFPGIGPVGPLPGPPPLVRLSQTGNPSSGTTAQES
jgi:hypothetical protein